MNQITTLEEAVAKSSSKKRDKGFTLVELLIVIVILGILATVTVFAVRGLTSSAKTNACSTERTSLQTSVEAYFAQNGVTTIPVAANAGAVTATLGLTPVATLRLSGFTKSDSTMYLVAADGGLSAISGNSNGCT